MSQTVFITGTDTGIGKTVVSAWACRAWQADYWKPVQAGLEDPTDTQCVAGLAGLSPDRLHPSRYDLVTPMSPHAAAAIDGVSIGLDDFILPKTDRPLVVEGAGGLMVPLNDRDMVIDLIAKFQIPAVLVTRSSLGTINHTLLSLKALQDQGIPILGSVMVGEPSPSNREALTQYGKVRILAEIPHVDPLTPEALAAFPQPPPLADLMKY